MWAWSFLNLSQQNCRQLIWLWPLFPGSMYIKRRLRYRKVSWKFHLHTLLLWNLGQAETAEQHLGSPSCLWSPLPLEYPELPEQMIQGWFLKKLLELNCRAMEFGLFSQETCVLIYITLPWHYGNDFQKNAGNCKEEEISLKTVLPFRTSIISLK